MTNNAKSILSLIAIMYVFQLALRGCWKLVVATIRLTIDLVRVTFKTIFRRK